MGVGRGKGRQVQNKKMKNIFSKKENRKAIKNEKKLIRK